jgi:lysozyme
MVQKVDAPTPEQDEPTDTGSTTVVERMTINVAGLDLLTRYEDFRPKPYDDGTGTLTIGYGHTRSAVMPASVTEEEAQELLRQDLEYFQDVIYRNVLVPLNENQFSALLSFVYNVGEGNFRNSTLLKKLNNGNFRAASDEFQKWNKGGGEVMGGLLRRRAAEEQLFRTQPPAKVDVNVIPGSQYVAAALSDPNTGDISEANEKVEINPAVVQAMVVVISPGAKMFIPEGGVANEDEPSIVSA